MDTFNLPNSKITLACQDRGSGPVLVLVHGFPFDSSMWRPQIDAFSTTHRVLAPDLPGFGQSTQLPNWTIDTAADVLNEWLDVLKITESVALAGLSMGGYIAMAFARKYPQRLKSLILADTKAAADDAAAKEGRDAMIEIVREKGSAAVAGMMLPKLFGATTKVRDVALIEDFYNTMARQTPEAIATALAALRDRPDALPGLKTLNVPTLVIVGEDDTITPLAQAWILKEAIAGAKLTVITQAGHIANREAPDLFNKAVVEFLAAS